MIRGKYSYLKKSNICGMIDTNRVTKAGASEMDAVSIGTNIKKYRIEKGIKQSELAEKTGVSANYIGILERGDKAPSLAMLVDIANTLGVTADMLLHGVLNDNYKIKGSLLLDRINSLPQKEQDRIFAVVEALIEHAE